MVYHRIHQYLLKNGLSPTNDVHSADLIVIDTCAYCQAAEDSSIGIIEHCLKHKHGAAKVLIVGCLPTINPDRLAQVDDLVVIAPDELSKLDAITQAKIPIEEISEVDERLAAQDSVRETKRAFHLAISKGCLGSCAYCAVNKVWGKLKSKPLDEIVKDFEAGLSQCHELFYLAAQDIGAYGVDIGLTVVDLLDALYSITGQYRLILHDFNPQWFVKHLQALQRILATHTAKVAYLDLPLQSGSQTVLKRMRRPYRVDDVKRALFSIKNAVPDVPVEIDLMVGFPGESDAEFSATKELLEDLQSLQSMCVWLSRYSDRPDTAAQKMAEKIDGELIMQRFVELQSIVEEGPHELGTGLVWYPEYSLL